MTYVLAGVALLSLAIDIFAVREFLHYIRARDERDTIEREQWAQERRELATRIQAPQMAPTILGGSADASNPESVEFDNDEDYAEKVVLAQTY